MESLISKIVGLLSLNMAELVKPKKFDRWKLSSVVESETQQ